MKAATRLAIALGVYIGLVIAFESLLGFFQPAGQGTLVMTTTAADGTQDGRVVARLESNDQFYVAANHWPRAWYRRARWTSRTYRSRWMGRPETTAPSRSPAPSTIASTASTVSASCFES